MSLFKRGNIWWVRFNTPNGQQIRKSAKTANKQLAQEYHDRLKAGYWRVSKLGEKPRRKWEEAVERWLIEKQGAKVTLVDDIGHLRRVHPHLYSRYLDEINREVLDDLTQSRLSDGVSNATVNRMLEVVRAILRRAEREWDWLERTPHIRMMPEAKRRIRWLTREEARHLLSELPDHLAAMAGFALATGLREANVVKLEWSQVDLDRRCAWIHADQAKARKAIPVPLNAEAIHVLRQQIGKHSTRVFTYKGSPVTKANNHAWRKALTRAGIKDFRWHDLRHTWASWHVQQGTPLHILQELGGWSDHEMVRRYAHLSVEHLAEYADKLSETRLESTNLAQSPNRKEKKRQAYRLTA
ncbi:tyrosine-type recombinase/integrase [Sedimenticola selenatireducens]|uniref:Site-specific integrase n=1 Tax=Sedimenticola selenatireducens TaxID=191960 RepID=A0A2N6CV88_9GAMM|nr:site-specific integrase [Sedimenticola selenatireducens]PLX61083.1 MAG: site-specific integrase [Sedimenticola selenatireducens]